MTNQNSGQSPKIPVIYLKKLIEFIQNKGISREVIEQYSPGSSAVMNNTNRYLSIDHVKSILGAAQFLMPDEYSAYEFGQTLNLSTHGLLGYTLLTSDDYLQIVSTIVNHVTSTVPLIDMAVVKKDQSISIELTNKHSLKDGLFSFLMKIYIGSIYTSAVRTGKSLEIYTSLSEGMDINKLTAIFPKASWYFSSLDNYVILPLSMQTPTHDRRYTSAYFSLLHNQMSVNLLSVQRNKASFTAKVTEHIINFPDQASLSRSAILLGLSTRYLRLQLAKEHTSFRTINNEVKQYFAEKYVKETPLEFKKISQILGFSDQACFTRAYRSWTGVTPWEARNKTLLQDE